MDKHLEIKTYHYGDIKVNVKIDFDNATISLIDTFTSECGYAPVKPKSWIFAERTLEYMNGWYNILEAMKYAIQQSEEELRDYLKKKEKEKHDLVENVLLEATDIVKNRNKPKRK